MRPVPRPATSPTQTGRWVVKRRQGQGGESPAVLRCLPGNPCESAMPTGYLGGNRRALRSFGIGAMLVVVPLVLAGCTSGSSQTASHKTSTSGSRSSASTTVTPGSTAKLIQPPGPISARPALLDEARAACRGAGASDIPLCAGTIDAEVWGLPLVILSQLRDTVGCSIKVNVLYNAVTLDGPNSTPVADPNDDTLYSTAFLDLRAGPQLLSVPSMSGRYVNFQLLDMYTNTIADIGVLTDGRPWWHLCLRRSRLARHHPER